MPKFYWTVTARSELEAGVRELAEMALPADWKVLPAFDFEFGFADDEIDAVVAAPESRAAKVAALRAHATQVSVEPSGRACALSNYMALPVAATEYYVLAAGVGRRTRRPRLGDRPAGGAEPGIARRRRGKLRATTRDEGMAMDPDLDPNLQHWQDRLDSFQWVVGSLVALLDSIPT